MRTGIRGHDIAWSPRKEVTLGKRKGKDKIDQELVSRCSPGEIWFGGHTSKPDSSGHRPMASGICYTDRATALRRLEVIADGTRRRAAGKNTGRLLQMLGEKTLRREDDVVRQTRAGSPCYHEDLSLPESIHSHRTVQAVTVGGLFSSGRESSGPLACWHRKSPGRCSEVPRGSRASMS